MNVWEYREPKWYHFKYKGGTFLFPHEDFEATTEDYWQARHWLREREQEGKVWFRVLTQEADSVLFYDDFEVSCALFKNVADAVEFKLMFM